MFCNDSRGSRQKAEVRRLLPAAALAAALLPRAPLLPAAATPLLPAATPLLPAAPTHLSCTAITGTL